MGGVPEMEFNLLAIGRHVQKQQPFDVAFAMTGTMVEPDSIYYDRLSAAVLLHLAGHEVYLFSGIPNKKFHKSVMLRVCKELGLDEQQQQSVLSSGLDSAHTKVHGRRNEDGSYGSLVDRGCRVVVDAYEPKWIAHKTHVHPENVDWAAFKQALQANMGLDVQGWLAERASGGQLNKIQPKTRAVVPALVSTL